MPVLSPRFYQLAGWLLTALLIAFVGSTVLDIAKALPEVGTGGVLADFDAFYITGDLALEGRAADAYDPHLMAGIQRELVGHEGFMPWTYPPQFDLLTMALPLAPRGIAYALFTGFSLAFYLVVIARLAGIWFPAVVLALAPPIYVTAAIGQNSFLTGGLMGLYCLLTLAGRRGAGWPLGLLVIKPHLGIGLGVHALASRHWRALALAIAITALSTLIATWAFGVDIWVGFLHGVDQAAEALRTEFYPLFRMTSIYAALYTLGVPPAAALWVQSAVGLAAMGLIAGAVIRGVSRRYTLALACFASALVSPYLYDYDMVIIGAGLALIAGDLVQRSSWTERFLLLALVWVAGGWGMIHALPNQGLSWAERAANAHATLSFGAYAYLLLLVLSWRILRRPARL